MRQLVTAATILAVWAAGSPVDDWASAQAARTVVVVPVPTPGDIPGKPIICTRTGRVIVCQ